MLTLTPLSKAQQLHRDSALVVVHGHDDIAPRLRASTSVGRLQIAGVEAAFAARLARLAGSRAAPGRRTTSLAIRVSAI